jgi:opacity protein-like surface antigen
MRMHRWLVVAALTVGALGLGAPAFADITGFIGFAGGPSTRGTRGVAVSAGLVIVAVEFEYADTSDDAGGGAPHIRTGMFNGILQTPVAVAGIQFYATGGAGVYNQELGTESETNVAVNVGGGVKVSLVGPLRLRVDYRVFSFSGTPIGADHVHRVYVGANVRF